MTAYDPVVYGVACTSCAPTPTYVDDLAALLAAPWELRRGLLVLLAAAIVVILKNEKMTAFVLNRLGESAAFKMVFEVVGLAKKALLEWRKSGNKVVDIQMNKI